MSIDDLWYKNAIIYCLDVEKYQDANGDGVGDFEGLMRRLDYLQGLGVTCVWLQPFYPSPNRDNGYDVTDYYGVHEKHGSLGDFVDVHAPRRGARHPRHRRPRGQPHVRSTTPGSRTARADPQSFYRDWYVWADERPKNHRDGIVFPGTQTTTWTLDRKARQYYFHRFYDHQPDLNTWNPYVRAEIQKIMGFWLQLGVSGFRMDAVPFLIEKKGAGIEHQQDFDLLKEMRDFLQWRSGDAILLAEANVPPDESMALLRRRGRPAADDAELPGQPAAVLRAGDGRHSVRSSGRSSRRASGRPTRSGCSSCAATTSSISAGSPTSSGRRCSRRSAPRSACSSTTAASAAGSRRCSATIARRLELAFSLLFSLPGTPMMQYGDEIGIGDDLRLPERECARTPMQWTGEPPRRLLARAARRAAGHRRRRCSATRSVNVAEQRRDPNSLLNWTERMIRMRKECPEIGWGDFAVLRTTAPEVLALRYDWRGTSLVTAAQLQQGATEGSAQGPNARTATRCSNCSTAATAARTTTGLTA